MADTLSQEVPYGYTPLARGLIRLLKLEPGDKSVSLVGSFSSTNSASPSEYTALSYAWGAGPDENKIVIDRNFFIPIRPNLHTALCALRQSDNVVILWVDAICINQNDVEERTNQVKLMTDIYQKASQVVAWLGEENESTEKHLEVMRRFDEKFSNSPNDPLLKPLAFNRAIAGSLIFDIVLASILKSPWFTRVWIVQEAAVNKNLVLQCGQRTFKLDSLVRAIAAYYQKAQDLDAADVTSHEKGPPIQLILNLYKLRRMLLLDGEKPDLRQLLQISRSSEATDPRDYAFALVGIAKEFQDPEMIPDYELRWGNCHFHAATSILFSHDLNSVLAFKGISSWNLPSPYPSWIPEWYSPSRIESFIGKSQEATEAHGQPLYTAGGKVAPDGSFLRGSTLHQSGKIFDTITRLEEGVRLNVLAADEVSCAVDGISAGRFQRWFVACADIARSCDAYQSAGGIADALSHTLVADCTPSLTRAPAEYVTNLINVLAIWDNPEMKASREGLVTDFIAVHTNLHGKPPELVGTQDMTSIVTWMLNDFESHSTATSSSSTISTPNADSLANDTRDEGTAHLVALTSACQGRLFCSTNKRYMGLVPYNAHIGDQICVLPGISAPLVLRREKSMPDVTYRLIGDCYIHGLMDGEAIDMVDVATSKIIIE